ncbi:hypothetical protein GALL_468520 [mine drainage metagenome]|uniref:Uncharacterized protein n=1 Tax=mine drainage metagenome TaxID=410659 RepID=A0A1J5Q227_9ZZZZ
MAPGHPLQGLGDFALLRPFGPQPLLARDHARHHAVGLGHALGHAGRAGGEQIFGHMAVIQPGAGGFHRRHRLDAHQLAEVDHPVGRVVRHHKCEGRIERTEGFEGAGEHHPVLGVDHLGPHRGEAVLQLGVVGGDQTIGRADRSDRDASRITSQHQEPVVQAVAGQHHDAVAGGEAAVDQPLGDGVRGLLRLAIGHPPPGPVVRLALEEVRSIGVGRGAVGQQLGDGARSLGRGMLRAHQDRAIRSTLHRHGRRLLGERLEGRRGHAHSGLIVRGGHWRLSSRRPLCRSPFDLPKDDRPYPRFGKPDGDT